MSRVAVGGLLGVFLAELTGLLFGWRWALPIGGAAVALFGLHLNNVLAKCAGRAAAPAADEALESLRRWRSQTEAMIRWSESTRGDWDRHLRPKLAGDFLVTTRQKKEDAGVASAGRLIFGDELWQWVDPDNVSRARRDEPGPGRAVLDDILQRLEQA